MTLDRQIKWLFAINAFINWSLSIPWILDPERMAEAFGGPPPVYVSVVRLWQGFVFMFGCMFWEVSRDVRGKAALIKYNWIEKTITACALTLGYWAGDVPVRGMILIVCTNWLWIPVIFYYDMRLRGVLKTLSAAPAHS